MSSSTFEVTETENETVRDLNFGLEACEENDTELSAQVDGEVQNDHTYTKDPDDSDGKEQNDPNSKEEESEKIEESLEKSITKSLKNSNAGKKSNPRSAKVKNVVSSQKDAPASERAKGRKEVLTEESNKSDGNSRSEKSEEKNVTEEQSKSIKRGKKRKVEEKENVIDHSIVEEIQSINISESFTDASTGNTTKKKNTISNKPKSKTKSKISSVVDGKDNQNLPKGWVRQVVVRKSGKTAGKVDIYIYSPDGIKFRSRPDIAAYLAKTKSNLKLENFNFSKKKISDDVTVKVTPRKEKTSAVKPKNIPEKKKVKESSSSKKRSKLLVKLNFSPKSKKSKNARKMSDKQTKKAKSSVRKRVKASSSSAKVSKKKKTA